jgi:uncharacterized membrane protein YfcA
MQVLPYIGLIIMGLIIGLMGSGGSIITIPILVYGFKIAPLLATTYSLLIVAVTSSVGVATYVKKKEYSYKIALLFVAPSLISVVITRYWLVPAIPDLLTLPGDVQVSKDHFTMLIFAMFMLAACYSMLTDNIHKPNQSLGIKHYYGWIPVEGIVIGFVTGLTGAGGGFLIIPSLVVLNKMPMRKAVGTSLLIISINSIVGFISDPQKQTIDPKIIILAILFTILGVLGGSKINSSIQPEKLKPAFGWFILIVGLVILYTELTTTLNI